MKSYMNSRGMNFNLRNKIKIFTEAAFWTLEFVIWNFRNVTFAKNL